MSFVKDDSAKTRGVGAIASVDMGSPRRRIAAARESRAMARRDAVMARSTLGRAPMVTSPDSGTYGTRSIDVDYFGRGAGGLKQPTGPTGGGGAVTPIPMPSSEKWGAQLLTYKPPAPTVTATPPAPTLMTPRSGSRPSPSLPVTKLPGSVTTTEIKNGRTAIVNGSGAVGTKPTAPLTISTPPPKTTTVIVSGPAPWTGVVQPVRPPMVASPLEPMPDVAAPSTMSPVKPASSNTLLYAALGIGALWLLTRE